MSAEIDQRFDRWTERLSSILRDASDEDGQELFHAALDEMWVEDPHLIAHWENCIDGCCPTGELLLSRLVNPRVSAPAMVRVFPELIKSSRTHRVVIFEEN